MTIIVRDTDESFVAFNHGQATHATNDGMAVLGGFLVGEVGARGKFFRDWLKKPDNDSISANSFYCEKEGDQVIIDHLNADDLAPFKSTKKQLHDVIERWESFCRCNEIGACNEFAQHPLKLEKRDDGSFVFHVLGE